MISKNQFQSVKKKLYQFKPSELNKTLLSTLKKSSILIIYYKSLFHGDSPTLPDIYFIKKENICVKKFFHLY